MLLFPDPRPLAERLGKEFFREAPQCAGVYLMRDAADTVLYVGKAKNLRKRLGSYRVANPDRMPRRHLRLLRAVVRIELRECADEAAALATESELLLALRPKFNRAGTWPVSPQFLAWRQDGPILELTVMEKPEDDWQTFGHIGGARYLQATLARLLWLATHPEAGLADLPAGWLRHAPKMRKAIRCGEFSDLAKSQLEALLSGEVQQFCEWTRLQVAVADVLTLTVLEADLELVAEAFGHCSFEGSSKNSSV